MLESINIVRFLQKYIATEECYQGRGDKGFVRKHGNQIILQGIKNITEFILCSLKAPNLVFQ